jgi:hypothetical protein
MNSNIFRGSPYQRGYGLGGVFKRFFNWIVPLVQKHATPAIESGLRVVGKTALSTAADIAKDTVAGKNFRKSATNRISSAVDLLKEQAEKKLSGNGIKRKRKSKKKIIILKKQKKKFDDIFG